MVQCSWCKCLKIWEGWGLLVLKREMLVCEQFYLSSTCKNAPPKFNNSGSLGLEGVNVEKVGLREWLMNAIHLSFWPCAPARTIFKACNIAQINSWLPEGVCFNPRLHLLPCAHNTSSKQGKMLEYQTDNAQHVFWIKWFGYLSSPLYRPGCNFSTDSSATLSIWRPGPAVF